MELNVFFYLAFLSFAQCELINLSCKQIQQFVDGHNSRRLMVAKGKIPGQPATSDMNLMVWDEELYEKASAWASKTVFRHNPNRSVPSRRFSTGENLFAIGPFFANKNKPTADRYDNFDVDVAMRAWFKEHVNYTVFGSYKKIYGHYTQMVWADSIYLGCALSLSHDSHGDGNNLYIVCNYGPAGNYIGEAPYKVGEPSNELKCTHEDKNICNNPYATCGVDILNANNTLLNLLYFLIIIISTYYQQVLLNVKITP